MFLSRPLLTLILVSLTSLDAKGLSVPLSRTANEGGTQEFKTLEKDRARVQSNRGQGGHYTSINITNVAAGTYTAQVGVGSPPTNYTLFIDTGSSNTWVGAGQQYKPSKSSRDVRNNISMIYGSGYFSGEEWIDTVTLTPDLVVESQSIGVAHSSGGFTGFDGILGLGPVDLTLGTVAHTGTIPTISDNLFFNGQISQEVVGILFVPISEPDSGGQLTFGECDESVIVGGVDYVSLTKEKPSSTFWGVDLSIKYGQKTILSDRPGIIDTGTTLILISSDAYRAYQSETGSVYDGLTGLLNIKPSQYHDLKTLSFKIGNNYYDLTPNAQIWPRSLNTNIGGNSHSIYLIVADIGYESGSGMDFTLGYVFLERYYTVYDTSNQRMGFAHTPYTYTETN